LIITYKEYNIFAVGSQVFKKYLTIVLEYIIFEYMESKKLQLKKDIYEYTVYFSGTTLLYIIMHYPRTSFENVFFSIRLDTIMHYPSTSFENVFFSIRLDTIKCTIAELEKIYTALQTRDTVWAIQHLQSDKLGFIDISKCIMKNNYILKLEQCYERK